MRLRDVGVGFLFRTRLTGRTGMVVGYTREKGVMVEWQPSKRMTFVHDGCEVDEVPGVLKAGS